MSLAIMDKNNILFVLFVSAFLPLTASDLVESQLAYLTEHLLINQVKARSVSDMFCSFRIYHNPARYSVNFSAIVETGESIELYENHIENVKVHPPMSKFLTACWNNVFLVYQPEEKVLERKFLGNQFKDTFTFVSLNVNDLEQALNSGNVIDKTATKYGMFVGKETTVQYLIEPIVYVGRFEYSKSLMINKKFNNLNGRTIRVPLYEVSPILSVTRDESGNITGYGGSHYAFTMELAKRTNCTPQFYGTDLPIGELLDNGTWTGFIGEVANGGGDYTPVSARVEKRNLYMNFTTFSYRESMVFCLRNPEPLLHWHALISPLSKTVWVFCISAFGAFMVTFTVIVVVRLVEMSKFSMPVFLEQGIFLPFALFLEQNMRIPTNASARIAAISMIWLAFIIGMAYKSNLVGYLTFPEKQSIPYTFKQLYEHKEYKIYMMAYSEIEVDVLKASPRPEFQGIVQRMKLTKTIEECLLLAASELAGCIMWKYIGHAVINRLIATKPELKSIISMQDSATYLDIANVMPRHSIYYNILEWYTASAKESGLFSKWIADQMDLERQKGFNLKKMADQKTSDTEDLEEDSSEGQQGAEKPLKVKNLVAIAYAYIIGCSVSVMCIMVEFAIYILSYWLNRTLVKEVDQEMQIVELK